MGSPLFKLPMPPRPVVRAGPRERERDLDREMFPMPPRPVEYCCGQKARSCSKRRQMTTHHARVTLFVDGTDELAVVIERASALETLAGA